MARLVQPSDWIVHKAGVDDEERLRPFRALGAVALAEFALLGFRPARLMAIIVRVLVRIHPRHGLPAVAPIRRAILRFLIARLVHGRRPDASGVETGGMHHRSGALPCPGLSA